MLLLTPLLASLSPLIGTDHVEILNLDLKLDHRAVALSPGGKVGMGVNGTVVVLNTKKERNVAQLNLPQPLAAIRFVDDDGGVVAVLYRRTEMGGDVSTAWYHPGGQVEVVPAPDEMGYGFEALGIGRDNRLYGTCFNDGSRSGEIGWTPSVAQSSGLRRVADMKFKAGLVAPAGANLLGFVPGVPKVLGSGGTLMSQNGTRPALYSPGGNQISPLKLPPGFAWGRPKAATPDGQTFLVEGMAGRNMQAAIYRDAQPIVPICREFENYKSRLVGISDYGTMAVGQLIIPNGELAALWTEAGGLESLQKYATDRKWELPLGWTLVDAVGISPDGTFLYGTARNWQGRERPFRFWFRDRAELKR